MDNIMLIIDDTEVNLEILQLLFEENYMILKASTGEEAVEILKSCEGNIDIILLDLVMPGMDGFEVLKKIKNTDYMKNIPVVVITSSAAVEDQVRAFDLGASDFVNKLFVPEIVISRVDSVMTSHRQLTSMELETKKLKVKSELDQMTGLYNKTTAEELIQKTLLSKSDKLHAMFLIDIDNFKAVNDTRGHLEGDSTICAVANMISSLFRKGDVVGRIGGDEFEVMMIDVPNKEIVREKARQMVQIMKYKPNLNVPENVSLSIGIAYHQEHHVSYEELFQHADDALYCAKDAGKAQYVEYGEESAVVSMDDRPVMLLLSENRNVCSVIQALIPSEVRVLEALSMKNIERVSLEDMEMIKMMYIDASEVTDSKEEFWEMLEQYHWMDDVFKVAICKEGELEQYQAAMNHGVKDILTTPIDKISFKRRVLGHLEKISR